MENQKNERKILYIDMDGVLADFESSIKRYLPEWDNLSDEEKGDRTDDICGSVPNFFLELEPIHGALDAVKNLSEFFDVYFLSAAMWNVPESYTEKRLWIEKHFDSSFRKKLILTHRKNLNIGDYLIDDRTSHGAGDFMGEHIHFGTKKFPNWTVVEEYLSKVVMNNQ
jgi:5'(3')-deoxyribonucleotidase